MDEDDTDSEGDEESEEEIHQPANKKKSHHRLSSKAFEDEDHSEYNSDLDQTMQEKYKERETANNSKRYK